MELLRTIAAARQGSTDLRLRCFRRLVGPEQGWLQVCREAVAAGQPDLLDLHAETDLAWANRLISEHLPLDAVAIAERPSAIAALARAILVATTDQAAAERLLLYAAAGWAGTATGAIARSAGVALPAPHRTAPPGFAGVVETLSALPPALAAPLIDLAASLAGLTLAPITTVSLPIVLDHSAGGFVAELALDQLTGLPAALYPCPRSLAFCALDPAFTQALRTAEALAHERGGWPPDGAVRWRLRPRPARAQAEPLLHALSGGSAGLGFALGLLQLGAPGQPLSRHWAVTGALHDSSGALASVRGYAAKLTAAADARLGLLYPEADQRLVAGVLQAAQTATRAVGTVDQALAFLHGDERPPCPYRGLERFREADAPLFFGRDAEITALRERVAARPPLVALLGSSGSGKSSLVHAGLLAGIDRRHADWQVTVVRPGAHPLRALAEAGLTGAASAGSAPAQQRAGGPPVAHRLIVLDQFEEALSLGEPAERLRFFAAVQGLIDHGDTTLLLVMRNDFYSQLNRLAPALMQHVAANQLHLPDTLDPAALELIIVGPARASGAQLEAGLAERIIAELPRARPADAGAAGALLPLLEFTLTRLWEESDGACLSHAAYDAIGGAAGALVTWGTQVIAQLSAQQRQLAERLLLDLVQPGDPADGLPDSRRRRTIAEVRVSLGEPDELEATLRQLVAARLLVSGREGERETVELIHEALVREWGYLGTLLEQSRRFLAWKRDAEAQLRRWQLAGEPATRLLPPDELPVAQRWHQERRPDLGAPLLRYLEASTAYWRQQRQRAQWARWGLVGLLSVVVLVLIGAFTQTSASLRRAEAERTALVARQNLEAAPERALREALNAYAREATPFTEETLHLVAQHAPLRAILAGHRQSVLAVAISPDGRTLATAGSDRTILLWELPAGTLRRRLVGHRDQINALAFSPDGNSVASAAGPSDPAIRLWDVTSGAARGSLTGHTSAVTDLAFSPDGTTLASVSGIDATEVDGDGSLRLWDVARRAERAVLQIGEPHLARVQFSADGEMLVVVGRAAVAVWRPARDQVQKMTASPAGLTAADMNPDGTLLALASGDGRIRLHDLAGGSAERTLQVDSVSVTALRFSPHGRHLLSGHADGVLRLWDVVDGTVIHTYRGHSDEVLSLAFSADGQTIVSGGRDRQARLWAVEPGAEAHPLLRLGGPIRAMAFSPDGATLAIVDGAGQVRLYAPNSAQPTRLIATSAGAAQALAFDRTGQLLAIGTSGGTIELWEVPAGRRIQRLEGHRGPIQALRFHQQRPLLASISTDDTLRLWDQRTGWASQAIQAHAFDPVGLAFSPDGASVFTASRDQTVRRWEVASGQPLGAPIRLDAIISALVIDSRGTISVGLASGEVRSFSLQGRIQGRPTVSEAPLALLATAASDVLIISVGAAARVVDGQSLRYLSAEHPLTAAALSPDGRLLALGDSTGRVRLILTNPAELVEVLGERLRERT